MILNKESDASMMQFQRNKKLALNNMLNSL